jgi:hypothetical protein
MDKINMRPHRKFKILLILDNANYRFHFSPILSVEGLSLSYSIIYQKTTAKLKIKG